MSRTGGLAQPLTASAHPVANRSLTTRPRRSARPSDRLAQPLAKRPGKRGHQGSVPRVAGREQHAHSRIQQARRHAPYPVPPDTARARHTNAAPNATTPVRQRVPEVARDRGVCAGTT